MLINTSGKVSFALNYNYIKKPEILNSSESQYSNSPEPLEVDSILNWSYVVLIYDKRFLDGHVYRMKGFNGKF